jgi:hypothetical protein
MTRRDPMASRAGSDGVSDSPLAGGRLAHALALLLACGAIVTGGQQATAAAAAVDWRLYPGTSVDSLGNIEDELLTDPESVTSALLVAPEGDRAYDSQAGVQPGWLPAYPELTDARVYDPSLGGNPIAYDAYLAVTGKTTLAEVLATAGVMVIGRTDPTAIVVSRRPTLHLPSDMTATTTSPTGTTVTWSASASDWTGSSLPVDCTPLSGSLFPLGKTPVNCSAVDGSGNAAFGLFNVSVSCLLKGDQDGDCDVDQNDVNVVVAARGQPATGPDDPRDIDGDGSITVLDARQLILMCTRPRCAVK